MLSIIYVCEIKATLYVNVKVSVAFSTKESLWSNINANNQLRIMKNRDLTPHKLLKGRY